MRLVLSLHWAALANSLFYLSVDSDDSGPFIPRNVYLCKQRTLNWNVCCGVNKCVRLIIRMGSHLARVKQLLKSWWNVPKRWTPSVKLDVVCIEIRESPFIQKRLPLFTFDRHVQAHSVVVGNDDCSHLRKIKENRDGNLETDVHSADMHTKCKLENRVVGRSVWPMNRTLKRSPTKRSVSVFGSIQHFRIINCVWRGFLVWLNNLKRKIVCVCATVCHYQQMKAVKKRHQ